MSYEVSDYEGDEEFSIQCTGDVVVGDEVRFDKPVFSGSWRRPRFEGFERITAKVIRDSYGKEKQQHTFTLELPDGSTMRIKGRNLYGQGVYRKPWESESNRMIALDEKHARGDAARSERHVRREAEAADLFLNN